MSAAYLSEVANLTAQAERGLMLAETVGHYLREEIGVDDLEGALHEYMARIAVLQAEEGPR